RKIKIESAKRPCDTQSWPRLRPAHRRRIGTLSSAPNDSMQAARKASVSSTAGGDGIQRIGDWLRDESIGARPEYSYRFEWSKYDYVQRSAWFRHSRNVRKRCSV